jgi:hypothetical protein
MNRLIDRRGSGWTIEQGRDPTTDRPDRFAPESLGRGGMDPHQWHRLGMHHLGKKELYRWFFRLVESWRSG